MKVGDSVRIIKGNINCKKIGEIVTILRFGVNSTVWIRFQDGTEANWRKKWLEQLSSEA